MLAICQVRDTLVVWDYQVTAVDTVVTPNSVLVLDPPVQEGDSKEAVSQQMGWMIGSMDEATVLKKAESTPMPWMEVLLFSTLRLRNRPGTSNRLTEGCYLMGEFLG